MIDKKEAVSLLSDLISIKSDYFHEEKIMKYAVNWLKSNNLDAKYHFYEDKKVTEFKGINIIGELEGSINGPVILINGHLDTVQECAGWTKNPFSPVENDGKLYGLGALDMKSGCAAAMLALKKFKETVKDFKGKIIYSFVSDEEGPYGLGTSFLIEDKLCDEADFALVLEPSSGFSNIEGQSICLGARGGYQYTIKLYGKSSHAATPENGINAIVDASKLIVELESIPLKFDSKLGYASNCIINMQGGGAACSVADYAEIQIFRHIVMGEDKQTIVDEVNSAALKANINSKYDIEFREAPLEGSDGFYPYVVDSQLEEVQDLFSTIKEVTGQDTCIRYFSSIGDFNSIAHKLKIPVIIYGPSGSNFHSQNEYVDIQSYLEVANVIYSYLVKKLS